MKDFLTEADYATFINSHTLNLFRANLPSAEDMAYSFVSSSLGARFDLNTEFARQDGERNSTLVRWIVSMSVYFLHNSIADSDIPERVEKNYDDARSEILKVSGGRLATDLTPLTNDKGVAKRRQSCNLVHLTGLRFIICVTIRRYLMLLSLTNRLRRLASCSLTTAVRSVHGEIFGTKHFGFVISITFGGYKQSSTRRTFRQRQHASGWSTKKMLICIQIWSMWL